MLSEFIERIAQQTLLLPPGTLQPWVLLPPPVASTCARWAAYSIPCFLARQKYAL